MSRFELQAAVMPVRLKDQIFKKHKMKMQL